jgi:hypothetical protein
MSDTPRWEQLNKCPSCGADMRREPLVGEQVGLYYRCEHHGRFRYSWDDDRLEPAPDGRTTEPPRGV